MRFPLRGHAVYLQRWPVFRAETARNDKACAPGFGAPTIADDDATAPRATARRVAHAALLVRIGKLEAALTRKRRGRERAEAARVTTRFALMPVAQGAARFVNDRMRTSHPEVLPRIVV